MKIDKVSAKRLETSGITPLRVPLNKYTDGSSKRAKGNI